MPQKPNRDYSKLPEPIPDTPENILKAVLNTPPKKIGEWKYSKEDIPEQTPREVRS